MSRKGHKKPKESTFGAPKKSQSSYFLFSNERRSILQKETGSSVTEISKIISAEWKGMDAETKKKYEEQAAEGKKKWTIEHDEWKKTDGFKKFNQALAEWKENEKNLGRQTKGGKGKKGQKPPKKPKQPEAMPKRPQSSYFIFSNERRNELKDQYPDRRITELSKLIAEEWKSKSAEAKKVYEDKAAINKEKYQKEIEEYRKTEEYKNYQTVVEEWKKEKKRFESSMDVDSDGDIMPKVSMPRKPKDDKCPKRPLTSYFLYAKAVREETKTEFPNKPITEIATEISKKWKLLSEEEKKPYNDEAARLKEQYQKDMEEYQGSDAQKEFKRKLEEWKQECQKRKQAARDKMEKKKAKLTATKNKKKSPKNKKKTKRSMEESSDEESSSDDSGSSSDESSSDDDNSSDSDSSSDESSSESSSE